MTPYRKKYVPVISYCLNVLNAHYPLRLINSVITEFNDKLREKSNEEDDYIYHLTFFEIKKLINLIEVPNCEKTETSSKCFFKKFHELTTLGCLIQGGGVLISGGEGVGTFHNI